MDFLYLSRRNLLTLLSKLDRLEAGEETQCAIIKYRNTGRGTGEYEQSMDACVVQAVPDDVFYGAQDRPAGEMHPAEEAKITKPNQGTMRDAYAGLMALRIRTK